MHKAQLDLVLNAAAIMLCVLAYDVRLGKERDCRISRTVYSNTVSSTRIACVCARSAAICSAPTTG